MKASRINSRGIGGSERVGRVILIRVETLSPWPAAPANKSPALECSPPHLDLSPHDREFETPLGSVSIRTAGFGVRVNSLRAKQRLLESS